MHIEPMRIEELYTAMQKYDPTDDSQMERKDNPFLNDKYEM